VVIYIWTIVDFKGLLEMHDCLIFKKVYGWLIEGKFKVYGV